MSDLLMSLRSLFETVDAFPSSIALRESQYMWAWITVSHVMSMCLFAGTVVMMDLRLLGVGNMQTSFSETQRRLFPWQMVGMVLSVVSGLVLVYAQPLKFFANAFFWTKMVMILVAGLNAWAFHSITYFSVASWDARGTPPMGAKLAGGLGVVLWGMVILAGRLIPYGETWFR
jgi:hypothetical protein